MAFCPNLSDPKVKEEFNSLVEKYGENRAYFLWDAKERISETQKTNQPSIQVKVKPGVDELFSSNPELASIGTPEQYSQYLDTIFPDSKVKDIVYHGSSQFGFDKFSKEKLGEFTGAGSAKLGFFFSNNLENSFAAYTANVGKDASFDDAGNVDYVEGTFGLSKIDSLIEDLNESRDFTDNEIRNKEYIVKSISPSGGISYGLPFKTKEEALENYKNDDWNFSPDNKIEIVEDINYGKYKYSKVDWLKDKPVLYYKERLGKNDKISISEQEYNKALKSKKDFLLNQREKYIKEQSKTRVYSILLDSKTLKEFDDKGNEWREETYVERIKQTLSENKDGLVIKNTYDPLLNDVYVVFEPEQIHILGNKQDIEEFKKFTSTPKAYRVASQSTKTINETKAKAWLTERFGENAVNLYENAEAIGNGVIHGYVENASLYLWTKAEVGTEYHEAYHLVFRTMLSNDQRQGLYDEAASQFGEPTANEIADIKKQFPDKEMSDEEARNLVLEEKMAEEFKEYVLTEQESGKTLPSKIANWFKNLWNWIKAMFSDNLSLKQTYSLISSNKMSSSLLGRGVFRNSEKFTGFNKAYLFREDISDAEFDTRKDTLYTIFIDDKENKGKNYRINDAIGVGGDKGYIATSFAAKLYESVDPAKASAPATPEDLKRAAELFEIESRIISAPVKERDAILNQEFIPKLNEYKLKPALNNNTALRNAYYDLYKNWNTTIDEKTGNVITYGWREILEYKLRDNGYKINNKDLETSELQDIELSSEESREIEALTEMGDVHIEKIYGKSSLEDSPSKRLTGKVKELLSKIKVTEANKFGVKTFMDKDVVYKELLEIFSGKESFDSMMRALEANRIYKPDLLNPVSEFINGLSPKEKAMIFNAFALVTTEFLLIKSKTDKKNNAIVEIFNPNRKSKAEKIVDLWRKNVISTSPSDRGLYEISYETTEEGDTVEKIVLNDSKISKLKEAFRALTKYVTDNKGPNKINQDFVTYTKGEIHPAAKAFGDVIWSMGLNIGSDANIEDTYDYVNRALAFGIVNDRNIKLRGMPAIEEMFSVLSKVGGNLSKTSNYIANNKAAAFKLAEMFTPMLSIAGESFVSSDNKAKYPTNVQSHLTEIFTNFNESPEQFIEKYFKDEFINTYGNEKYQSILFRVLKTSPRFREMFKVYDLDAIEEGEREESTLYEDFSNIDSLVVRLNCFVNGGKDTTKIGVPVQADRNKYSSVESPRLGSLLTSYKLNNVSSHELIVAQIVQDFVRMNKAKKDLKSKDKNILLLGYHTDSKGNILNDKKEFVGNAFNQEFFQIVAVDENDKQIVTDEIITAPGNEDIRVRRISDVIEDFVTGKNLTESQIRDIENRLSRMASKVESYFERRAADLIEKLTANDAISRIQFSNISATVPEIAKAFVTEEALMRNELVKLFRGSRAYAKNIEDFYKRMAHLTTPGGKYALKKHGIGSESWLNGEAYGLMDNFNEVTLADLRLNLNKEQIDRVNKQAADLANGMILAGYSPEDAAAVENAYKSGSYESTDAQAFISIDMYRSLQQGEGNWGEEEEVAYKAYKSGGTFSYQRGFVKKGFKAGDAVPVKAIKTYYEKLELFNGSLIPVSEKNSYNVLLREYTNTNPHLNDLRSRMELDGGYQGKNLPPIHVANFVSAKKLAKRNVYTITGNIGEYAALDSKMVNINDSSGLRKPQIIPDMKDNPTVTLNRQIKKNMLANVKDETTYALNAGLDYQQDVSGEDLKFLMHSAIEEKLSRDIQSVLDELKITDLDVKNLTNEERLDILKTTRDIILDQIIDKELSPNYIKSLNIKMGEDGLPKFNMPLDLPFYGGKFEPIIMSILNNKVFKQSVKGYEGVQIAQIGGHEIDNELKFYGIDVDKNGKPRLVHAEISIREDLARKFGVKPGDSLDSFPEELRRLIGYRIPNQDKASTVIVKIKSLLPANYEKAVAVPGQFVKLMGSDFDVDKLFLMFPEIEFGEDGTPRKVVPPYLDIVNKKISLSDPRISYKMLNNIVLDSMEAVMANPAHFKESLSPLDDLKDEAARIRKEIPELAKNKNWNDFESETDAMLRNQAGNKLRGIYANIIAGMNVAQHGTVNINKKYAIQIDDTAYYSFLPETKDGKTKDKAGSLFLSASVDAGKDPVQMELNDTIITSKVRALFLAFHDEYDSKTCTNFLNQPAIRKFTEIMEVSYNNDPRRVKNAFNAAMTYVKNLAKENNQPIENSILVAEGKRTFKMESSEINNLSQTNRDYAKQALMLNNFYGFYRAGNNLLKLYKRITPDSMDGLNMIGNIQSYKDKAKSFDAAFNEEDGALSDETFFIGADASENVVEQFVGENSLYGLERGYERLMDTAMKVANIYFPLRTSKAVETFKERIKQLTNKTELNSAMHKLVDSNLMFLMLSKEDSPFRRYLNQEKAAELYMNPVDNIYTKMQALIKEFPKLGTNAFLSNIEKDSDVENGFYGIKFDNSFSFNREEKTRFTNALKTLIFNPQVYLNSYTSDIKIENGKIADDKMNSDAARIKNLGISMIMNTFLTNGFRPGAASYADLIPIEYLNIKQKVKGSDTPISIAEFIENETLKMGDANYFKANDIINYMSMFGGMKADGIPLLDRVKNKGLNDRSLILDSSNPSSFVFFVNPKTKKSGAFMNTGQKNARGEFKFVRLGSMFKNKSVYTLGATLNITPGLEDAYSIAAASGYEKLKADINERGESSMFETCRR